MVVFDVGLHVLRYDCVLFATSKTPIGFFSAVGSEGLLEWLSGVRADQSSSDVWCQFHEATLI